MSGALLVAAAYLLGAIPTSLAVTRALRGIDLREQGSGNLGATNAYRVLGWKPALAILLFDAAKGWFPTVFFPRWDGNDAAIWTLAYGTAAILGHVFSPYAGFRGGKGVATGAGVFVAIAPVAVGVAVVAWITLVAATGFVSLGSLIAAALIPLVILLTQGTSPVFWFALTVSAFVTWSHRSNIGRLLRGEERRLQRPTGTAS